MHPLLLVLSLLACISLSFFFLMVSFGEGFAEDTQHPKQKSYVIIYGSQLCSLGFICFGLYLMYQQLFT